MCSFLGAWHTDEGTEDSGRLQETESKSCSGKSWYVGSGAIVLEQMVWKGGSGFAAFLSLPACLSPANVSFSRECYQLPWFSMLNADRGVVLRRHTGFGLTSLLKIGRLLASLPFSSPPLSSLILPPFSPSLSPSLV